MKKIMPLAASIIVILVAGLFAGAGTMALFSDTENIGVHDINAGTLDLKLDGGDVVVPVTINNIAPGWSKEFTWKLQNTGTLPGKLSVEITTVTNKENGQNEPEAADDSTSGDLEGELGAYLLVNKQHFSLYPFTWNHVGRLTTQDDFQAHGGKPLNECGGRTYYSIGHMSQPDLGILDPGESQTYYLSLTLPSNVGNIIQSDSVEFDIIFHLDQA